MLIIGANEIETNTISVRHRNRGDIGSCVPKNLSKFEEEVKTRSL